MIFNHPEWFLLLPVLLLLGYQWRGLKLFKPLRLLCVVLITLIFTSPTVEKLEDSLDLWVLYDESDSTEELVSSKKAEWEKLLEKAKPNNDFQIIPMEYAAEALKQGAEREAYTGSRKLTRTRLALEHVAALASDERPSRVLLFTDGYSTEPLGDIAEKMNAL